MKKVTNMIQAIDYWAEHEPERLMYDSIDEQKTYRDLKEQSDRIAMYLAKEVPAGPIIVYGGQEFEMIASFVACSKAGRAYIPIETHTPSERFEMICSVAKPALIIETTQSISDETRGLIGEIPTIRYDHIPMVEEVTLTPVSGDDTYYIIFTSGTTGVPKGVQISHDNLVSFVNWELSDFGLNEGERFLSQAPYSFDLSVMSVYPSLVSGGTLLPLTKDVFNDFKRLFETLPKMDINVWVSTPSSMDLCLMDKSFNGDVLSSISCFLFCGEELSMSTAQKLVERFPNARIYNTYGPTEATVAVTAIQVTEEVLNHYDRLPIGHVKEDTRIIIMEDGKPLATGEVGEIIIAGPSVSKGYMNNPEKTAEAFFEYEGTPAYHTGDAGHFDEDGILRYDGRIDFQVKVHGYRMELEDIDHHLNQVSYIKQAVVVPKYKEHKVQQLIAYVIPNENDFEKDYQLTKAIKEELSDTVMDYMIPQRFVYVDQLPLTPNGKIDRKGLINEVNNG